MGQSKPYHDLCEVSKKIHVYNGVLALLSWDQETYMPPGAIVSRCEQISQLAELVHKEKTGPRFKRALGRLISLSSGKVKVKGLSMAQKAALREWHKEFLRLHKLPVSFVKTFSRTTAEATQVWARAKKANDFKLFAPFLEQIVALSREKAALCGFEHHPYDALLEHYEPCMNTVKVGAIFDRLQKRLKSLVQEIGEKRPIDDAFLRRKVADDKQMELAHLVLSKMPIESAYSRLDLSAHPFSTAMHPHDSRITTRIIPNAFMSNIFSVLHEAGHSLYEMGLPIDTWGTPLSEAVSLSIHESQSRWWETLIGRSLPFWQGLYPDLRKALPALKRVPLERFHRAINKVDPSFIRVEADEVTYCLHVIVRFEIEKELISGRLSVFDLPEAWNAKMKDLFGKAPPNDAMGCLQDIHWSLGDFGYFPTYALGNLCAAQFFTAFAKKHPDWAKRLATGELVFIRDWLKNNIHRWGRTFDSEQLVKKVTGKPLSETAYCAYLEDKYTQIYDL